MAEWRQRMAVTVSAMEIRIAERLNMDGVRYLTQEPLFVSSADFYFPTIPKPLVVFLDGPPHLEDAQIRKDDIFRTAIRKAGYRVLELPYAGESDKTCENLYQSTREELAKLGQV